MAVLEQFHCIGQVESLLLISRSMECDVYLKHPFTLKLMMR